MKIAKYLKCLALGHSLRDTRKVCQDVFEAKCSQCGSKFVTVMYYHAIQKNYSRIVIKKTKVISKLCDTIFRANNSEYKIKPIKGRHRL